LGLSYALPSERKTRVIPEISGIVGITSYNLGRLESEDAYVQVNKVRFMDYSSPDVDFQTLCVGLKPGISFLVDAGGNRAFGIRLAYQLSLKFGYLNFTGINENGDDTGAVESLSARNVDFKVSGTRTSKSPFNPDGVEINLFYCF
jgi:hypothetical protein